MFKEQLNMSFENIKPSPELLDRISAMMSEEVSRKKPPLQMRAVKYAGIAAAVALAAGGTLLAVNNANHGIDTAGKGYSIAAAAADTPVTALPETAAAVQAAGAEEPAAEEMAILQAGIPVTEAAYTAEEAEEAEPEAAMFIMAADSAPVDENGMTADYDAGAGAEDNAVAPFVAKIAPETTSADGEAPLFPDAVAEAAEAAAPPVPEEAIMEIASIESADAYDPSRAAIIDGASADYLLPEEPVSADELPIEEPTAVEETAEDEAEVFIITVDDPTGVITDIPKTAACGEIFEIKTGVVYDADVLIYADGEEVARTHYDSDYWGFMFTMPDHDVVITVKFSGEW